MGVDGARAFPNQLAVPPGPSGAAMTTTEASEATVERPSKLLIDLVVLFEDSTPERIEMWLNPEFDTDHPGVASLACDAREAASRIRPIIEAAERREAGLRALLTRCAEEISADLASGLDSYRVPGQSDAGVMSDADHEAIDNGAHAGMNRQHALLGEVREAIAAFPEGGK